MSKTMNKKLLKTINLLYVEDDEIVRSDLTSLLSKFFGTVYSAQDGQEGLDLYKKNQKDIDVIVSDINMPVMTGIEMLKNIRQFDKEVPTIFATAYSDKEFLVDAIKLKVSEYMIKPLDIRNLMVCLNEIAKNRYNDLLVKQQNKEMKKYKDVIFSNNIVIKTDKKMKITFVNELFCKITGFDKKELIGQEISCLKHKDVDKNIYKKIYDCVLSNKTWNGELKNITKDGTFYYALTTVVSTINDSGEITGSLVIQKDETEKEIKRKEIQSSLIKDKSEIFKKSKKSTSELTQTINQLNKEIEELTNKLNIEKQEKNHYIYTLEKYSNEKKKISTELSTYKKDEENFQQLSAKVIKLTKENSDLKTELKKLKGKLEIIEDEHKKRLKQQKINFEVEIDDLEKLLNQAKEKLENIGSVETLSQKLAYWKEKAKREATRSEKMEREIIAFGDKGLMAKAFEGR